MSWPPLVSHLQGIVWSWHPSGGTSSLYPAAVLVPTWGEPSWVQKTPPHSLPCHKQCRQGAALGQEGARCWLQLILSSSHLLLPVTQAFTLIAFVRLWMQLSPWLSWGHLHSSGASIQGGPGLVCVPKGEMPWVVCDSCGLQGRGHCDISLCHYPGSRGGSLGHKHHKNVQPFARVRWVLCSLSAVRISATGHCTDLGDWLGLGLRLSFILANGSKKAGKCAKDGFDLIFQSTFPREEESSALCQPPGHLDNSSAVLGVPSKRVIRAGCKNSSSQQAGVGSTAGGNGSWVLPLPLLPISPFFFSFLTSMLQHHPSKHLPKWRLH